MKANDRIKAYVKNLEKENKKLQQENDELRASNQRLIGRITDLRDLAYNWSWDGDCGITSAVDNYVDEVLAETPKQSLAKIKSDAIREMLDEVWRSDTERVDIEDYATNLEQRNE